MTLKKIKIALLMLASGPLLATIFIVYVHNSSQQRFSLTDQCSIENAYPVDNNLNQAINVGTIAKCHTDQSTYTNGTPRYYTVRAMLVQRDSTLYVHTLPYNDWATYIDSISNKDNSFILYQVQDRSECKFHYVLIHLTKNNIYKELVDIGCTTLSRLSTSGNFVYVMTTDNSLQHAYLRFYAYDYLHKKWSVS